MRLVLGVCFLLLAATLPAAASRPEAETRALTIVVKQGAQIPADVMREMRYEMDRLLGAADVATEWRVREEIKLGVNLEDLVVVTFRGRCELGAATPGRPAGEAPRALAQTHVTDGAILPFAEVHCDRVAALAREAMWGSDFRRASELLGRALARVLAHEIFHIIGKEHQHGEEGVFKHALSGRDLIAERLDFHPRELRRMRESGRTGPAEPAPTTERVAARD